MTKYWTPPFSPPKKNYQKDSEWPKMDFKYNFLKCKKKILVYSAMQCQAQKTDEICPSPKEYKG